MQLRCEPGGGRFPGLGLSPPPLSMRRGEGEGERECIAAMCGPGSHLQRFVQANLRIAPLRRGLGILKKINRLRFIGNCGWIWPSRLTARGVARDRHDTRGGMRWPRGFAAGSKEHADERILADVKSQRPDTPMLVSHAMRQSALS